VGVVGIVAELWRWPVEPMGGERLRALRLTARGVNGDRVHEVAGTFTPEEAERLRGWRATYPFNLDAGVDTEHPPWAMVTGGPRRRTFRWGDPRLAHALEADLGRPVELRREPDVTRPVVLTAVRPAAPVDLRANLVLHLEPQEEAWVGAVLAFAGGARLEVTVAHAPAGVLARVLAPGRVGAGEAVELA
jgi:hypothetical protein